MFIGNILKMCGVFKNVRNMFLVVFYVDIKKSVCFVNNLFNIFFKMIKKRNYL